MSRDSSSEIELLAKDLSILTEVQILEKAGFGEEKELMAQLLSLVEKRIEFLLNHEFEKLKGILYRIDVDEEKLKARIAEISDCEIPREIAKMIIERQLDKIRTREKYRKD